MDFKAGDVVQLKSGGALMTVKSVDEETVSCVWQERKGTSTTTKREEFEAILLTRPQRRAMGVVMSRG